MVSWPESEAPDHALIVRRAAAAEIDDEGLSVRNRRRLPEPLGGVHDSRRNMTRRRVHTQVADLLDRTVAKGVTKR
jgi:hypothetical protein